MARKETAITDKREVATPRTIPQTGLFASFDPFQAAIARTVQPPPLLSGKKLPESLVKVGAFLEKPPGEWTDADRVRAIELMGHWIDSLKETLEFERWLSALKSAPKRVGRPKKRQPIREHFGHGLLDSPPPKKVGGRIKWAPEFCARLYATVEDVKRRHSVKSTRRAVELLFEEWAASEGITKRAFIQKLRNIDGGRADPRNQFRNLLSRYKKSVLVPAD